jgi:predicted O-methyltransferase YrrM
MNILSCIRQRPRLFNWLNRLHLVKAYSQTRPDERACLCRHIAGARTAVEIGTFMGLTAGHLALALPENGILYCIDPYPSGGEPLQQIALRQIRRAGVARKVRMIRSDSAGAVASLPAHVDFFFVDGDHSFEGLAADWQVVKQLLCPGGIAAFHDTAHASDAEIHSEGAIQFFEDIIARDPDFEMVEQVLSLNVIRRKLPA